MRAAGRRRFEAGSVVVELRPDLAALVERAVDVDVRDAAADGGKELVELSGIDDERAKNLITTARAHWFE